MIKEKKNKEKRLSWSPQGLKFGIVTSSAQEVGGATHPAPPRGLLCVILCARRKGRRDRGYRGVLFVFLFFPPTRRHLGIVVQIVKDP